ERNPYEPRPSARGAVGLCPIPGLPLSGDGRGGFAPASRGPAPCGHPVGARRGPATEGTPGEDSDLPVERL
ncbi:MAG: hypothetical protein AVDCRST_MAG78-774, partial [uncultured Rubrobacteraceae bacterium]